MLEGFTGELHVYDLLTYSSIVHVTADSHYHLISVQISIPIESHVHITSQTM